MGNRELLRHAVLNVRSWLEAAVALLIAVMWVMQEILIFLPSETLIGLSLIFLCAYSICAFSMASTSVRLATAMAGFLTMVLVWRNGHLSAVVQGAHAGVVFIAFLASMQLLKVCIEASANPDHAQLMSRASLTEQSQSMLLRSWLLASIFAAGTLTLVAANVSAKHEEENRPLAQAALHGVALALLWSPFFVAMAVCTRLSPKVSLLAAVCNGLAMAFIGLCIAMVLYRSRLRIGQLRKLSGVFAATAGMAVLILSMNGLWDISNTEAIVVSVPLIAMVVAAKSIRLGRSVVLSLLKKWMNSLRILAAETLIVVASLILGEVIKELLGAGLVSIPEEIKTLPALVLIAWPALLMGILAIAGFHPIIGASLLFPLQASMSGLAPVVAAGSVMTGWMVSILVSTFAVPVLFAASLFKVTPRRLVTGHTRHFLLFVVPSLWIYLWLLNLVFLEAALLP